MKILITLMLAMYAASSSANEALDNISSYLRRQSADVVGSFRVSQNTMLYNDTSGMIDLGIRLTPKDNVSFSFSERHISISPGSSIDVLVQGIRVPVKIERISYHEATGKFEVKTDSPLGIVDRIGKEKIEAELTRRFKGKLQTAFTELKKLRSEEGIKDTGKILNTIVDVFGDSRTSAPCPDITGNMELVFTPNRNETIALDKLKATVKKDDRLAAAINFSKRGNQLTINTFELYSTKGVGLAKKDGNTGGVASLNFTRLSLGTGGVESRYTIGAEEMIGGMAFAFEILKSLNGVAVSPLDPDCIDDVQLQKFRNSLDTGLRNEIASLIRNNRQAFLNAKFNPRLLDALD